METKQQIDHLIELAIVQRAELKRLVEQLPALRSYLLEQINATIEDMEPQLRGDLIDFCDEKTSRKIEEIHAFFNGAKSEFKTKSDEFFVALEKGAQARFEELQREKQIALDFAEDARRNLAAAAEQEAAKIPAQVSQLVEKELARFPRAGEIDQLRKEFSEPRGLNPRGKWKSTETYQKLDLVAFNGDSYISNVNDNREKPSRTSVSWTLSAARGQGAGGGGITSLNDILGNPTSDLTVVGAEGSNYVRKTLTAGTNITLTETPSSITIDAAGGNSAQILTATVTNAESVAITRGQVVYAYAATGNRVSVKLAYNTSDATSAKTFGVVSDDSIAAGATGTVTCVGVVDKLNLGTYAEGDTVYLGATAGTFTATKPYAPNHLVYVGIVQRANAGNGELYVKIQNGYELDEIHDVQITAPVLSGSTLLYDATNSLWKNARLTGTANQVKVTNADNSVTLGLESQIAISGQSLTGSSATSLLDLSTTWNTTGNPTAIKLNVTNTASGSSSNLLDLQVGGVSAFRVAKNGITTIAKLVNTETKLSLVGTRDYNIISGGGGGWGAGNFVISDQSLGYDVLNVSPGSSGPSTRLQFDSAGNAQFNAQLKTTSTTAATSTTSGSFQTLGGAGIAGAVYAGADSYFNGVRVGKGNSSLSNNVVVGVGALNSATTGNNNIAIGTSALTQNLTGSNNTAIGYQALYWNTASGLTALGFGALQNNTSGGNNAAVGYLCLYSNTTGDSNVAFGNSALYANTTGSHNVGYGKSSLASVTTGGNNVGIGSSAVGSNVSSNYNVGIGYYALQATTGGGNLGIGSFAGAYETGSNAFYLNNYNWGSSAAEKTGSLLYGTFNATPSSQTLTINAATTVSNSLKSNNATGGIGYATGAGGAVTQATSRTTGVTLNTVTGAITLVSAAGTTSWQSFTVTNSAVAATDVVRVVQKSGTDLYQIHVTNVAAGSFQITYATTGGTTTEQPVFNFAVIKGVAA